MLSVNLLEHDYDGHVTSAVELGKLECREALSRKPRGFRPKKMPYAHISNSSTRFYLPPIDSHDLWCFNWSERDTFVRTFLDWTILRRRYRPVIYERRISLEDNVRSFFDTSFVQRRRYNPFSVLLPVLVFCRQVFASVGNSAYRAGAVPGRRGSSARLFDVSGGSAKNFLNKFSSLFPPPLESGLLCIIDWLLFYRP